MDKSELINALQALNNRITYYDIYGKMGPHREDITDKKGTTDIGGILNTKIYAGQSAD